ncbi:MAG: glycosyltransferase family 9 protein [Candidatus Omnitrophica bacterium]|nr:glycosyltransferase family 9 protein [Candidatus Omnitrophota bacterium]
MKKIVILKYSAIGDVLRTTAILPGLKNEFPGSEIYWITEAKSRPVLENNHFIKKVYLESELTEHFKKDRFDLIINLDEDYDACQLASELKGKILGYYLENGKIVCSQGAKYWMSMSLLGADNRDELKKANKETYQKIMYDIIELPYDSDFSSRLFLTAKEKEFGSSFAKKHKIDFHKDYVVGINSGAGKRWPLKKLEIKKIVLMINKLIDCGLKVILLGGEEEVERNQKILSLCSSKLVDAGLDNSIREFASIINICDSIVTADTLAMHISISLGKHTLVFFGPTPWHEIEFYGKGEAVFSNLDCLCCMKKIICEKKPNCMELINEDLIIEKILQHKQISKERVIIDG